MSKSYTEDPSMYAEPITSAGGKSPGHENEENRTSTKFAFSGWASFVNSKYSPSRKSTRPIEISLNKVGSGNWDFKKSFKGEESYRPGFSKNPSTIEPHQF